MCLVSTRSSKYYLRLNYLMRIKTIVPAITNGQYMMMPTMLTI